MLNPRNVARMSLSKVLSNAMLLEGWVRWRTRRSHCQLPNGKVVFFDPASMVQIYGYINTVWQKNAYGTVQDGGVIVDAGASIGVYALKHCDRAAKIYAFEPEPTIYGYLAKNVAFNHARTVVPIQMALSNVNATLPFHITNELFGNGHELQPVLPWHTHVTSLEVDAVTLDQFFAASSERIDMVKVDVEGHELALLEGAHQLLTDGRIATLSLAVYHYGEEEQQVREFLEAYGYQTRTRFVSNGDIILYARLNP